VPRCVNSASTASKIASAATCWASVQLRHRDDADRYARRGVDEHLDALSASPSRTDTPCSAAARFACYAARLIHSCVGGAASVVISRRVMRVARQTVGGTMNCTTDDSTGQVAVWPTTGDQRYLLEPQHELHLQPLANVQPGHIILDETLIDQ
jgi:hypothetical protein